MPEFSDLEKLNEPAGIANSIGFWIYHIVDDMLKLSTNSMENFGIKNEVPLDLVSFKSHILGIDIPVFLNSFGKWLEGDCSDIMHIRVIDTKKNIKTMQIKGHARRDEEGNVVQLYGAYIDISNRQN
ncbi:hypothetical protein E9993_19070 [Labilibacter sediminis]|nr:hypothetical protein E9993_19070 [Labilibacter sediminis]